MANGNLSISPAGSVTGSTIALSAIGAFINNRGSDAVTASNRWLIYSNSPNAPGENFGNLNSNNTAIWNNTYATLPPASVTVPGNRYIFAFAAGSGAATLTVTSLNDTKTYGSTANLTQFTVSGFQAGLSGSLTRAAGEKVGSYAITQGSLSSPNYNITFVGSTLVIDINAATLISPSSLVAGPTIGNNTSTNSLPVVVPFTSPTNILPVGASTGGLAINTNQPRLKAVKNGNVIILEPAE